MLWICDYLVSLHSHRLLSMPAQNETGKKVPPTSMRWFSPLKGTGQLPLYPWPVG